MYQKLTFVKVVLLLTFLKLVSAFSPAEIN